MTATSFETVFRTMPSPVGILTLAAERDVSTGTESMIALLFERHAHGVDGSETWRPDRRTDGVLAEAARQLAEYFAGDRRTFDLPLAPRGTEFQLRVWRALRDIPFGETTSYGDLALRLGDPRATRAVGAANGRNPISIIVPCHRVIGADRSLTGFGGGIGRKRWLLEHEARTAGTQTQFALSL
jgi:methylated-DNA-[protein]-cysteine S-methyltransferase